MPNNYMMHSNRSRSFGGKSGFGGAKFGRSSGRNNRFAQRIDPAKFVRKATEFQTIEEVVTDNNWQDFGLDSILYQNIITKGFVKPTLIQDQVIPQVLKNRDVMGIANTGTGKTAAFAIPLIQKILHNPNERILILAPTRELATQIKQEFREFTPGLKIYLALAIGGAYLREQIMDIKRGPNVIIGTPGRIKDLGERRVINFSQIKTVVLDEVDRMLDMGFVQDIRRIMDQTSKERQTLFFSATMDRKVETLIDTLLKDPAKIVLKSQDVSSHVDQNIIRVNRNNKQETLYKLLKQDGFKKVLVFGATKRMVETLSVTLTQKGFRAGSIHGNKAQYQRQQVLKSFREDKINILVATDVAARGLDIADITHVINYDQPNNYEDYIHRVGRTGRGNSKGFALTFVEERY